MDKTFSEKIIDLKINIIYELTEIEEKYAVPPAHMDHVLRQIHTLTESIIMEKQSEN